jgi:hypothetical protein
MYSVFTAPGGTKTGLNGWSRLLSGLGFITNILALIIGNTGFFTKEAAINC